MLSITVLSNSMQAGSDTASRDYGIIKNQASPHAKLRSVNLRDVRWTEGFWADRFAQTRILLRQPPLPFLLSQKARGRDGAGRQEAMGARLIGLRLSWRISEFKFRRYI